MNSESADPAQNTSTSCRRGRPRGSKSKKRGQIMNISRNTPVLKPSTSTESSSTAVVCDIVSGFNECMMRIITFFASINPKKPKQVDLSTLANYSRKILQQFPNLFDTHNWSITIVNKIYSGYSITATGGISKQYDSFNLEIPADGTVVADNLNYWFSMEQHKFTIFKCEATVFGILKFEEKYYMYDPNPNMTVNQQSLCKLTECYNTEQLAEFIQNRMDGASSCKLLCHLIAITESSTTAHSKRLTTENNNDETNSTKRKIIATTTSTEECGSSAKKSGKDDSAIPTKIIIHGPCTATANKQELFMHICSFFCVLDNNKPNQTSLDSVVRVTEYIKQQYPDFSIKEFDCLGFVYENKPIVIYIIVGRNKLNTDEEYDTYDFMMFCNKTVLVNNLKKWFAMGYHEKTVFHCFSKVFGILKNKKKYYVFDPNECFSEGKEDTTHKPNLKLRECNNIEELADILYDSLNNNNLLPRRSTCTVFAVNTLAPVEGTDLYVTTDPPSYERSHKVQGRAKTATLLSKETDLHLEERRKTIQQKKRKLWHNLSDTARQEALQRLQEYSARRWEDMSEAEREAELNRKKENSAKRWENMSEAGREAELNRQKEYSAKRWENMSEAERDADLNRKKEHSAKRWENLSEAEREAELKKQKEEITRRRKHMSEAKKEAVLKRQREYSARRREDMTEAERVEERRKKRVDEARRVAAMSAEEKAEQRKKNREYDAQKRKSMTTEQRAAEKLKAKERYRNNDKEIAKKNELTTSIKKHLKFKGRQVVLKDAVVGALGGRPESHMEAETLVNSTLQIREQLLNQQSRALVTLFYTFKHRKAKCDEQEKIEDKYVTLLGTSLHTKHSEAFFPDTTYRSMPANTYALNENGLLVSPAYEGEENTASTWYCNENCDIDVAVVYDRLYTIIEVVLQSTVVELIRFIDNIDNCVNRSLADVAKLGHPKECYIHHRNSYGCSSILLFLRSLAPHYPFMRNIVSAVYKVRRELKKLREVDTAIDQLDIAALRRITDALRAKAAENFVPTTDWPYANENSITAAYLSAFVSLQRISSALPTTVCISCMELCFDHDVRHINDFHPHRSISNRWDDLLDVHETHNYKYGKSICSYCYDKFNRERKLPPTCLLNKLQVREPPLEISRLNDYEKMLIQRAKAFQVVTRMGAVSKKNRPKKQMIEKVIGRTFHLPLPIDQTLAKMPTPFQAIAANQDLYILVRGIPNKQKQIFQQFVNVNNVYEALQWLKANNHLYKDVRLPSLAENILDELDNEADFQFDLDLVRSQTEETEPPAMLTQKDIDDSFYEQVTLHSIGAERPNEQPSTVYQLKKVFDQPIDSREIDLDIRCFPHLFCYGENGQFTQRQCELPLRQFMKNKVRSVFAQFRLNIQYLFFLLNIVNMRQISSSIYSAMNITKHVKNMTAHTLRDKLSKNEFDKNASSIFTSLRNSKAFWNKPRNDINCMVKYYGPATWFLTISPSEYNWDDLEKYLRQMNPQLSVGKTISALIALDPVSTSRFIDNKFKAMLAFINSKDNPIGEVEHYAWRREYQSRGLQHFHLMIWIKDAPILGESTNEEVADFISKYATCRLPDKINFPTLYSRVMSYQQHYHNSYCMRSKKTKQGRFIKRCRFDFPRPVTDSITLRDVATSIHGRRKLKLKSRLYDLRRTEAEVNINDYNPAVLMAWEGNMDIQYIGEKTGALCAYITKYNTKPEKSFVGDGFSDIPATKPLYSKLWLMGQRILSNRECGTLEAADTLLEIPLFGKDCTIQWLDVRMERNRKLRDWKHVATLAGNDTDIFLPSLIDTHYPKRPTALDPVCLFDFASKYDIVNKKPVRTEKYYEYGTKYVIHRKKPCLINHYNYNMEKDSEKYFYALLLLYKPFRNETELLGQFKTYAESFDNCKEELTNALQYHEKLQEIARAKDALDKQVKRIEEASQEAQDVNVGGSQRALGMDDAIRDMRACIGINNISDNDLSQMVQTLNADQTRVFSHITATLLQQHHADPNYKVLRHFVSGVGGTGKSHLISVIRQWVKNELDGGVIVAAPTGIAAHNVKGLTIHRFLKMPVEHGSTPEYRQLSDMNLQQLRNELQNVKLIIIDEVSMVSNFMLLFIHLRLQEIYNSYQVEDGWFGGMNILLFGDLLQLSPVNAECPFVTMSGAQLSKIHSSLPSDINLWKDIFSYDELTINQRQQSDLAFANILSRIRLGIVDDDDQEELESRLLHFTPGKSQEEYLQQLVTQLQSLPSTCVCLFATKRQCAELNAAMLSLLPGEEIILKATDEIEGRTNIQRQKAQEYLRKIAEDSSSTAALEETLTLKIGCKVMLRRNISTTLVNGSIGTIREIIKDAMDDSVSKIKVQFATEEHLLERLQVKFEVFTNLYVVRSQFPITLAYGITIHKSQSLSLDCCLMDLGNSIFCAGQTYVALSRVTSLNGLYLVNYDRTKVLANDIAIHEYNRLRRLYRPDLNDIAITVNDSSFRRDILWWKIYHVEADPASDSNNRVEPLVALPGFQNNNNNCFANATLQCLFSITSMNRNIMLAQDSPLKRLAVQYNNPNNAILNSDEIIEHVGFQLGQMQDASEFIMLLAQFFPHITNDIQFTTEEHRKCTRCLHQYKYETETNNVDQIGQIHQLPIPNVTQTSALLQQSTSKKAKSLNINDFMRHSYAPTLLENVPCPACGVAGSLTQSITITEAGHIFIVALHIFNFEHNNVRRLPLKISAAPSSMLDIAGSKYALKASIFHRGRNQFDGHYTAYIAVNNGWYLLDDRNVRSVRWPQLAKNAYILFYEKAARR